MPNAVLSAVRWGAGLRTAWAISTPTGLAPSTIGRRGTAFIPVASRLVQMSGSSRRPGTGIDNGWSWERAEEVLHRTAVATPR